MYETEWVDDLPRPEGGRGTESRYLPIAQAAMSRPGQWLRVPLKSGSNTSSIAQALKKGTVVDGKFEAATRKIGGQHYLYTRYVGPK